MERVEQLGEVGGKEARGIGKKKASNVLHFFISYFIFIFFFFIFIFFFFFV